MILLRSVLITAGILSSAQIFAVNHVVVYTALDREFSEPLFAPFEERSGIEIRANYDTESTKTVGLTNRIMVESRAGSASCDVFWNNEILNTLRLKRLGLLQPLKLENSEQIPAAFRDQDNMWFGFAARARVLIVNTDLVSEDARPSSILDLTNPEWLGRVGIAKPLFGTTATHVTCLFAKMGAEPAKEYLLSLKRNKIQILKGNKQVAQSVATGQLSVGFTDTDDAIIEVERGMPVAIVFPDSKQGQMGTLFIPNTVAVLKGSSQLAAASELANYLLSADVERTLAEGPSAQIPLNPNVDAELRVETPHTIHAMEIKFEDAIDHWEEAARFVGGEFVAEESASPLFYVVLVFVLVIAFVAGSARFLRS